MSNKEQAVDTQAKFREEYKAYLWDLFRRAQDKGGFNFVLTLLRFDGMSIGYWDPMVEAHEALSDLSEMIRKAAQDQDKAKRSYRLSLLVYCHATEMSAPYEILYNILNCVQGKNYEMSPFAELVRPKNKKDKSFLREVILPSPRAKIEKLREKCKVIKEPKLMDLFDSFFRQDIRNAFYHSDYCIDLNERTFNITEVRFGKSIPLEEINEILFKGFAFYEAFFQTYYGWRFVAGKVRRFYRWPRYEVLELLSNEEEGLYGFTIHISNGTRCTFERHKDSVIAENVMFEKEGFSLQIGSLEDLREEWRVREEPYREPMDRNRYNGNGEWKPIVYPAPAEKIQAEVTAITEVPREWGSLFYMRCSGQRVIEFHAHGTLDTDLEELICSNGLRLYRCSWLTHEKNGRQIFVYDGTMPVNDASLENVKTGLAEIETTLIKVCNFKNAALDWDVKYSLITRGSRTTKNEDGSFTTTLDLSDPRNVLVVSDERVLPARDWKMKLEWIKHPN
jgi:hypothetical protein